MPKITSYYRKRKRTSGRRSSRKRARTGATRTARNYGHRTSTQLNVRARRSPIKLFNGLPQKAIVTMDYFDNFSDGSMTSAAGAVNKLYEARLNSLFDPQYSVGGHQPHWFDQFAAIYEYYNVFKVEVMCTFIATSSASTDDDMFGHVFLDTYAPSIGGGACTTATNLMEGRRYRKKLLRFTDTGDHTRAVTLKQVYYPNKLLKQTQDEYWTSVGTNPTHPLRSDFAIANTSNTAFAASAVVRGYFKIRFWATFRGLKENVVS